jgi:hypothetical protein
MSGYLTIAAERGANGIDRPADQRSCKLPTTGHHW